MTAYAFEIRGGTACQRCGVFVTVVMACHHNTRLCNQCAFYEPCERCDWERYSAQYGGDDDDEESEECSNLRTSKRRTDDIKDGRLS